MARSRDISKVLSSNTTLATDAEVAASYLTTASASTVYQTKATAGLTLLTPASIANTGGTASIGTNGTVSFSAASTVSLNNVFNSTYDSYRIVFTNIIGSANAFLRLRFRKAASDNSTSAYYSSTGIVTWTGVSASGVSAAAASSSALQQLSTTYGQLSFDVTQPLVRPMISGTGMAAGPEDRSQYFSAFINASDTFDGFTFFPASGNITGALSVYGYNK